MRRAALGIIAVLLLTGGIALQFTKPGGDLAIFAAGVCMKTGAVLALFWLAYDQVLRFFQIVPPWFLGAVLLAIGVFIAYPNSKVAIVALGLLGLMLLLHYSGFLLKPLNTKRPARPKEKSQTSSSKSQISEHKS